MTWYAWVALARDISQIVLAVVGIPIAIWQLIRICQIKRNTDPRKE